MDQAVVATSNMRKAEIDNGSEMIDKELDEFAEQMYNTMVMVRRGHSALQSGARFDLSDTTPGVYLHHRSELGEFFLTSDGVTQTFTRWISLMPITEQLPEAEHKAFMAIACTIGGFLRWLTSVIIERPVWAVTCGRQEANRWVGAPALCATPPARAVRAL